MEKTELMNQVEEYIEKIEPKDTALLSMRAVSGKKIQLEFAEYISDPNRSVSAAGIFNESDDRFTRGGGPRRGWMSVEKSDLLKYLNGLDPNLDINSIDEEGVFVGIMNPKVKAGPHAGKSLKVRVLEVQHPSQRPNQDEWEQDNIETAAKQTGNGQYCMLNGEYIFSRTDIVIGKAVHSFLQHDALVSIPSEDSGQITHD